MQSQNNKFFINQPKYPSQQQLPENRDPVLAKSLPQTLWKPYIQFPRANCSQNPDTILGKPFNDIRQHFIIGKELGRGRFGVTYLCIEKSSGRQYACKSISKGKLVNENDKQNAKKEIQIVQHLRGNPNIVEFKGAYEDRYSVHLVMELCAGGELFDRMIAKGRYNERDAALICREVVSIVHNCHLMGVMHRDLNPENILLTSKDENAVMKVADFGSSVFIEEGKVYQDLVGKAYYVAPEVLQRRHGKEIDIWSAGVILYILLSGVPPFWAETEKGIFDAILQGHIDLQSAPWPSISDSAKDLIRKMLTHDPKKRITSARVLEHPWIRGSVRRFWQANKQYCRPFPENEAFQSNE